LEYKNTGALYILVRIRVSCSGIELLMILVCLCGYGNVQQGHLCNPPIRKGEVNFELFKCVENIFYL
jgi:hypothetical protein